MKNALSNYIDRLTTVSQQLKDKASNMMELQAQINEIDKIVGHMEALRDVNDEGSDVMNPEPSE